jgi:hypothetical protein
VHFVFSEKMSWSNRNARTNSGWFYFTDSSLRLTYFGEITVSSKTYSSNKSPYSNSYQRIGGSVSACALIFLIKGVCISFLNIWSNLILYLVHVLQGSQYDWENCAIYGYKMLLGCWRAFYKGIYLFNSLNCIKTCTFCLWWNNTSVLICCFW